MNYGRMHFEDIDQTIIHLADERNQRSSPPEFDPAECRSCGACAEVCASEAIMFDGGIPWFNFDECIGCMECVRACPRQCITQPDNDVSLGGESPEREE